MKKTYLNIMKLPSINYLVNNAAVSLRRFPLTILSSLLVVITAMYAIEYSKAHSVWNFIPYVNLILAAGIGIPLFFCAKVVSEKFGFSKSKEALLSVGTAGILAAIYFSLPITESSFNTSTPYFRYISYNVAAHLLVSFIPYFSRGKYNGFWQYNKTLFIRFLLSQLYSGFLTTGIFLAYAALNLLFNVKISEELYPETAITLAVFFNTWFFVSGIPKDFDQLEYDKNYPKGLKIFSQYVLLSLLGLYLLILYMYGAKILISGIWPKGVVAYLIVCISVLGALTFLLLYPYGKIEDSRWIKKISKLFYIALFPLLFLLFFAILLRIDDYGITVNRYIILALGIWLTAVCIYTAIGRTNIKFIPSSLAFLLLLTSFGPWGIYSVSEKYQVKRLQRILEKANILKDGRIQNESMAMHESSGDLSFPENTNNQLLNDSLRREVSSILDYLDEHNGFSAIKGWYSQNIDSVNHAESRIKNNYVNEALNYMHAMGLSWQDYYEAETAAAEATGVSFNADTQALIDIAGYDQMGEFDIYLNNGEADLLEYRADSLPGKFNIINKPEPHFIFTVGKSTINISLQEMLQNLLKRKQDDSKVPLSQMTIVSSGKNYDIKIVLSQININLLPGKENKIDEVTYIKGMILLKKKP